MGVGNRIEIKTCLLIIDLQNDFCSPGAPLFVRGRTGSAAMDDGNRTARFIRNNVNGIDQIFITLDSHMPMQIFHPCFWVDAQGNHPPPFTAITVEDVFSRRWMPNRACSDRLHTFGDYEELEQYCLHYVRTLRANGRDPLEIWPYHCLFGSSGHALVRIVEDAVYFHAMERNSNPIFVEKGFVPYTENYSVFEPEVGVHHDGELLVEQDLRFMDHLKKYDRVVVAGEAKSHCVRRSIESIVRRWRPEDLGRIYVLEDCMSSVVIADVADFTDEANEAFQKFAEAGIRLVKSTDDMASWPPPPVRAS